MKDVDFGSFRLSGFGFNTTLLVLNCTDLAKITFSVSKKSFLEIFLNRSKNPKNYFHAKPFGKSFNHIGNRPFFKFQSQKGKMDKIIDTTLHFRTKTSDFFFFFHQLKCQYCFPCQTLRKIIYSYWEEAIFQVSEPESKN